MTDYAADAYDLASWHDLRCRVDDLECIVDALQRQLAELRRAHVRATATLDQFGLTDALVAAMTDDQRRAIRDAVQATAQDVPPMVDRPMLF